MIRLIGQYSEETEKLRQWCDKNSCVMRILNNFHDQEEYRILMGGTAYNNNIRNLVVPDGFHEIIEYAFKGSQWMNLKSIKLPSSLIEIERGAIYNSTKIIIPYNMSGETIEKLIRNGYNFSIEEPRNLGFVKNALSLEKMREAFSIINEKTFDSSIKKYTGDIIEYIDKNNSLDKQLLEDELLDLSRAYSFIGSMMKNLKTNDDDKISGDYKQARLSLKRLVEDLGLARKDVLINA